MRAAFVFGIGVGTIKDTFTDAERWQSGRSRPPRKREYLYGYREFESPPLRQFLFTHASGLAKLTVAEFESAIPRTRRSRPKNRLWWPRPAAAALSYPIVGECRLSGVERR